MSQKPLFKINNNVDIGINPFWSNKSSTPAWKIILKNVIKWLKLFIFAFFMFIGLWGCFQTMWDQTVASNAQLGSGLEFGYAFGTTGDYDFDLCSTYGSSYFTYTKFTMEYGPFYGIFIYPICVFGTWMMYLGKTMWGGTNALLTIFILLIIIRTFTILVTLRSTIQNEKMGEVQGKISEINAKYKDVKDMESRQRKQQEIMATYKKYKIKPFASLEQIAITLPIFMVIYRFVSICRPFKSTVLFNIWSFAASPGSQILSNFADGGWIYVFFLLIILPVQFISTIMPQRWAKHRNRNAIAISSKGVSQLRKTKRMQYIFAAIMCTFVVIYSTGVGVYWFLNSIFSLSQSYLMHKLILRSRIKHTSLEAKLEKLGLE